MDDKALLEAAARAAGLYTVDPRGDDDLWCEANTGDDGELAFPPCGMRTISGVWNPLADDGDALRLAVKLEMHVLSGVAQTMDGGIYLDQKEQEPYAATRRAIVLAAASLGQEAKHG